MYTIVYVYKYVLKKYPHFYSLYPICIRLCILYCIYALKNIPIFILYTLYVYNYVRISVCFKKYP